MPNMYIGGKCDECGATVDLYEREKHTEFHEKIDELIEWAQAVSKLFNGPQEVKDTFTLPHVTNEQIVAGRMIDGPSLSDGIPRDDV